MSSSVGSAPRPGSAQWLPSAEWRYSVSLMLNWTLIGSTCETVVMTVDVLARVPTCAWAMPAMPDRKSTRLNSSHGYISYAVFCLKKKKKDAGLLPDNQLGKRHLSAE